MTVVASLTACHENELPIPMQVEVKKQVEIVGNRADRVRADTSSLMIVRDSVLNEKTDTVYNLKTSITILLDSTFMSDKMEESLQLKINDLVFVPADSAFANTLINFLKSDSGTKVVVDFVGKAEKSRFLSLQNATNVSVTGFSFHELDPEALADPQITSLIKSFERLAKQMDNDMREYGSMGVGIANIRELCEMRDRLRGVSDRMTPKQAERFRFVETHYQSAHTEW